jgi:hypothetical protein
MNQIVIGRGQIGSALVEVLGCASHDATDGDPQPNKYGVLHIAIPYTHRFTVDVAAYERWYDSYLTIIYSTVPIGTCEKNGWVHSPIEGKHPDLAESLSIFPRFIGSSHKFRQIGAQRIWEPYTECILLDSADHTEFLKLRSTARYGVNLAFADYEQHVADTIGMDWAYLKMFDTEYNLLYEDMNVDWAKRYVLDPPNGYIGGHCVVPNAKILNDQYPDDMLETVIRMGE